MRITLPLTGTLLAYKPVVAGDDSDPIRLVDINLGNVSWELVALDLDNDQAVIEVTPADGYDEPTGQVDPEGNPICWRVPTTPEMKAAALTWVRAISLEYTQDQLYQMSGNARLRKPLGGK